MADASKKISSKITFNAQARAITRALFSQLLGSASTERKTKALDELERFVDTFEKGEAATLLPMDQFVKVLKVNDNADVQKHLLSLAQVVAPRVSGSDADSFPLGGS